VHELTTGAGESYTAGEQLTPKRGGQATGYRAARIVQSGRSLPFPGAVAGALTHLAGCDDSGR